MNVNYMYMYYAPVTQKLNILSSQAKVFELTNSKFKQSI